MNQNLTEVIFVLDRSGSMGHLTDDTIGGFNSLIEKQKEDNNGEVKVTTVLFDDYYEMLHSCIDIKEIQPLTRKEYYARGTTAMLDAVGRTIDSIGERLAATPEEERPSQILFVITTDGYENASRKYSWEKVKSMIEHQRTKYNWNFIFLGANIDAEATGENLGIAKGFSKTYTASKVGTESVYRSVNNALYSARGGACGQSISACLDDVE